MIYLINDIILITLSYIDNNYCCYINDIITVRSINKKLKQLVIDNISIKKNKIYYFNREKYYNIINSNICSCCNKIDKDDIKIIKGILNSYYERINDKYNLGFRMKWDKNFNKFTYIVSSKKININNIIDVIHSKTKINVEDVRYCGRYIHYEFILTLCY